MSYKLLLTRDERKAIDWIGNRYAHGNELAAILDNGEGWDDDKDIEFTIPEHIAWQIADICEEDNLACFVENLTAKLWRFCKGIV